MLQNSFSSLFFYLVLQPLSRAPLSVLYHISNAFFFVMYRILRFRGKVVYANLRNAFPDLSAQEIEALARKFYRHLADLIMENIRTFSIPAQEARERLQVTNPELLHRFYDEGKSVLIVIGHYNNWEWVAAFLSQHLRHQVVAVYSPLSNAFFDRVLKASRSRFGTELIPKADTVRFFMQRKEPPFAVILAADQSPTFSKQVHWTTFLNQDTAVMTGAERFGQRYDFPVVFGHLKKVSRGHYALTFSLLEEHPTATGRGAVTEAHTRMLEKQILEAPEFWLWTHRRWKRKR